MHTLVRLLIVIALFALSLAVSAQEQATYEPLSTANIDRIEQITAIEGEGEFWDVRWSPDGQRLAVVRQTDVRTVEIWDFVDNAFSEAPTVTIPVDNAHQVRWLPDGQHIVTHGHYLLTRNYVAMWDANTGELTEVLLDEIAVPQNCCDPPTPSIVGWNTDYTVSAIKQDNHTIALSSGGEFAFRLPIGLDSPDYTEVPSYGSIAQAEWSPGNSYIAVVHVDGSPHYSFHLIDVETLESVLFALGPDYDAVGLVWSPDETTLAVASYWYSAGSGVTTIIVRFYRIGELVRYGNEVIISHELLYGTRYNPALVWSPDSSIIAIASSTAVRFFETSQFEPLYEFDLTYVQALDWHPSTAFIISGDGDGTLHLWGVRAE